MARKLLIELTFKIMKFDSTFTDFVQQLQAIGFVMNADGDNLYFKADGLTISAVPYTSQSKPTIWFQFNGQPEYDDYCNSLPEFIVSLFNAGRSTGIDFAQNRIKNILGL